MNRLLIVDVADVEDNSAMQTADEHTIDDGKEERQRLSDAAFAYALAADHLHDALYKLQIAEALHDLHWEPFIEDPGAYINEPADAALVEKSRHLDEEIDRAERRVIMARARYLRLVRPPHARRAPVATRPAARFGHHRTRCSHGSAHRKAASPSGAGGDPDPDLSDPPGRSATSPEVER